MTVAVSTTVDIATHLLVPYAAALAAFGYWRRDRPDDPRRAAWALVFGVAGFAPDLDGGLKWLAELHDGLYFMQHRGVSHSLVGAPLFALAFVGILSFLAPRIRRLGPFSWRPGFVAAAVLGSWTHLALDAVTLAGVPLLWPFAYGRWTLGIFSWLVIWLLPVCALVLGGHAWGRISRRGVVVAGVFVVAALVVLAGLRLSTRPDLAPGELLFPRDSEFEWLVATPMPGGGWRVAVDRDGLRQDPMDFVASEPPEASATVASLRDTDNYRGYLMGRYGPEVVVAVRDGSAWDVTFTDVAQRYEALDEPRWTPTQPDVAAWGYVRFLVRGDTVEVAHRGW